MSQPDSIFGRQVNGMRQGCFSVIAFLILSSAFAAERYEFYNGVRSLGMGGVTVAVVNDETALLDNPAGLGKLRNTIVTLIDPEIHASTANAGLYLNQAFTQPFDLTEVDATTDASREKHLHAITQLFPSIVVKNFGLGLFAKYSMDAEMNSDGTAMQTDYTNDLGALIGYNFRFFDGRIKLGVSGKYISRTEIHKAIDPAGSLDLQDHASSGAGFSTDVGLILTAPWTWLPTIAAVARNVGGLEFTSAGQLDTAEKPTALVQDVDVGLAVFPIHTNHARSSWSIEYKGVTTMSEETDSMKRIHFGTELNLYDAIFLRAGLNQRYWTAGIEFATENFQLQFATYGEEIGTVDNTREDRRVVGKFAFRF